MVHACRTFEQKWSLHHGWWFHVFLLSISFHTCWDIYKQFNRSFMVSALTSACGCSWMLWTVTGLGPWFASEQQQLPSLDEAAGISTAKLLAAKQFHKHSLRLSGFLTQGHRLFNILLQHTYFTRNPTYLTSLNFTFFVKNSFSQLPRLSTPSPGGGEAPWARTAAPAAAGFEAREDARAAESRPGSHAAGGIGHRWNSQMLRDSGGWTNLARSCCEF